MKKATATTWPDGTPRSQNNAFTSWRIDMALGIDSIFARDYVNCTALFNQWRAAQKSGHGKGHDVTWAEFRDANTPRGRNFHGSHLDAPATGFKKNRGTIHGLSDKADAMIAKQGKLMPPVASAWNGGVVKPPHGGAFSKAKPATHNNPAHLARKPARPKARKVAA